MYATLRTLSTAAFLIAVLPAATWAADLAVEPHASALPRAVPHRCYHSALVAGVRGATPLTVPFVGRGWYPGPVHYYGPPPGFCCCESEHAIISARY